MVDLAEDLGGPLPLTCLGSLFVGKCLAVSPPTQFLAQLVSVGWIYLGQSLVGKSYLLSTFATKLTFAVSSHVGSLTPTPLWVMWINDLVVIPLDVPACFHVLDVLFNFTNQFVLVVHRWLGQGREGGYDLDGLAISIGRAVVDLDSSCHIFLELLESLHVGDHLGLYLDKYEA